MTSLVAGVWFSTNRMSDIQSKWFCKANASLSHRSVLSASSFDMVVDLLSREGPGVSLFEQYLLCRHQRLESHLDVMGVEILL